MTDETNILALIPGEFISQAGSTLPDAATDEDGPHEVTIDVPDAFGRGSRFADFTTSAGR